eukprot:1193315-Prorocentrum_minimum.AAC.8
MNGMLAATLGSPLHHLATHLLPAFAFGDDHDSCGKYRLKGFWTERAGPSGGSAPNIPALRSLACGSHLETRRSPAGLPFRTVSSTVQYCTVPYCTVLVNLLPVITET